MRLNKQPHHEKRIRYDEDENRERMRGKLAIINDTDCDPYHCAYPIQISKQVKPPRK